MPKMKLEKITGVVALSYLVLIPVGAYYAWQRLQAIDADVDEMWGKMDMPDGRNEPNFRLGGLFRGSRAR